MLIQVIGGPTVGYEQFIFPDGQRHLTLDHEITDQEVWVTASVTDADSLFDLLLLKNVLDHSRNKVFLRLEYLMGGRMDRRIDGRQPATLEVVANVLRNARFAAIQVLDPHSDATLNMLVATPYYPMAKIREVMAKYDRRNTVIVQPDKGAATRISVMLSGSGFEVVGCSKKRDPKNGTLTGFKIYQPHRVQNKRCLIVDDICDGGGTFIGLAKLLKEAGAVTVDLFVTHGIFSKGLLNLLNNGIDEIHYTGSFRGKIHPKIYGVRSYSPATQEEDLE